jgi:hypothetical protein
LTINSLMSTSISPFLARIPQFFVNLLNSDALATNFRGGYVSSKKKSAKMNAEKSMNEEMYSVHLHPRYDIVRKPPIKGASIGPIKTVAENAATARPRVSLLYISAKIAATTVRGQDPKKPSKNREIMTVWTFAAVAIATTKIPNPKK